MPFKARKEFRDARLRASMRVIHVLQAITSVDQHEAVRVGFDQQAVADEMAERAFAAPVEQRAADRAIRTAIEVVNAHRPSSCCSGFERRGRGKCPEIPTDLNEKAGRPWGRPALSTRYRPCGGT
jgi:hypothetical protein